MSTNCHLILCKWTKNPKLNQPNQNKKQQQQNHEVVGSDK